MSNDEIVAGIAGLIFLAACHITMHHYWKKRHRD